MDIQTIIIRIVMIMVISGIIGYEREKNQSAAGLKTHSLVGISATLIAIIQDEIHLEAYRRALENPDMISFFGADPARLTAQVISGIGFLGAGTIIVTKRNIAGLTTAASIWSVACLGIAVGTGYYEVALLGAIAVCIILYVFKRFIRISANTMLIVKFMEEETWDFIQQTIKSLNLKYQISRYNVELVGDHKVLNYVLEFKQLKDPEADELFDSLSSNPNIIQCEKTLIEV